MRTKSTLFLIGMLSIITACVATERPHALADEWEFVGEVVNEPGYHVWGCSPIQMDDGKVHLFAARWPISARFVPGWHTHCEIARYVADRPEGPFKFAEVVVTGSGKDQWDKQAPHNPNIQRVGNRFVLTYIANRDKPFPSSQTIGMLVADSIEGPWKPANGDASKPMLAPPDDPAIWCRTSGCGVNNPALLPMPDGTFHLYFKAMPGSKGGTKMGLAIAKKIEGPFVIQPEPVTANDRHIEDGYAFLWNGRVCLMTTDNSGMIEPGGGLLWISKDGLKFDKPLPGFHHFGNYFFPDGIPEGARHHYSRMAKNERPQILVVDGEPAYLYTPSGTAMDGSDGTNNYLFRRKVKADPNPLPTVEKPRELAPPSEGGAAWISGIPLGTPGHAQALPATSRVSLEDHAARMHVFANPDWFQWGGSVVQGEDGKYHMFYARWRRDNDRGMRGWLYTCQIAHATAGRPEGPYTYQKVVLEGFGQPQADRWDAINAHNPCITRMTDPNTGKERYYLYFVATRDDNRFTQDGKTNDWLDHICNQRVGVAVADSPDGPWTRHPKPVITPPNGPLHHYLVNPGVCQLPDGRYLMVLKGRAKGNPFGPMLHGWALSDRPEGPFKVQESLLFPAEIHAEDPCVWVEGDWIFAAVKDWSGQLSGKTGISYVRGRLEGDDLRWEVPKNNNISPRALLWDDGKRTNLANLERPFILRNTQGMPTHLFAACSVENPFVKNHDKPGPHLPFNVCLPLTFIKTAKKKGETFAKSAAHPPNIILVMTDTGSSSIKIPVSKMM